MYTYLEVLLVITKATITALLLLISLYKNNNVKRSAYRLELRLFTLHYYNRVQHYITLILIHLH